MDYTKDVTKYLINEAKDNHLVKGEPLEAGEGLIAILKKCDETQYSHRSIVLYRDTIQDTDANAAWCTKAVLDDGTIEYTLVATTPINEELVVGDKVYVGANEYGEIYFIGEEETNWYEFTLQNIEKHIFVEKSANLAKNLEELLKRLEAMKADKLLEDLIARESSGLAQIDGPKILENESPVEYTITYTDPAYKNTQVEAEDYEVRLYKPDGSKAPNTVNAVITNKTKDSCTVEIIGFRSGSYSAEIIYKWTEKSTDQMRLIKTTAKLSSWFDPVIMVETNGVYNQLEGYGMMVSPSTTNLNKLDNDGARHFTMPANNDITIFQNAKNLTKQQCINPEVLKICVAKNWCKASQFKIDYLKDQGLSDTEATALATKFMVLSEAMAVTQASLGTTFMESLYQTGGTVYDFESFHSGTSTIADSTTAKRRGVFGNNANNITYFTNVNPDTDNLNSIIHFEQFGYFTLIVNIPIQAFYACTHLVRIYLPLTATTIENSAFFGTQSLIDLQTLND